MKSIILAFKTVFCDCPQPIFCIIGFISPLECHVVYTYWYDLGAYGQGYSHMNSSSPEDASVLKHIYKLMFTIKTLNP